MSVTSDILNDDDASVGRYLAGDMTPDEEVAFERTLTSNPALAADLAKASQALGGIFEHLAKGGPAPRRDLKGKILAKIAGGDPSTPFDNDHFVLKKEDSVWMPTVVDGISYRLLYSDEDGRVMVLAKLEPGAIYPDHVHRGTEECYVVSGDLQIHGHSLTSGDFIAARKDSDHENLYTKEGCELLLKLPVPYELFPPQ